MKVLEISKMKEKYDVLVVEKARSEIWKYRRTETHKLNLKDEDMSKVE
jgi:hypothetical protein